ncbi:hypothetical protein [Tenacibaculum finnmarkense]|uniref:hypothetical protein n=1 Tax=Tenacibaculum finnmarkense TaxID=2781243 RepID=UPI00187BB8D0|nr:hypothetical protein [Tenacibaculum finnmarkense]MBE7648363.1 hypothetical protein [Tenacibaculum finnmarkense genomovar ulcerans]MBE7693317.1 hypothetical protein [Tenacibaculum finnmarkense genomovar finnmarkense]MCD8403478.1 hypothetical protein [Tenacibaculum finnmarkense genomovar finnmarkense]MCD8412050.1 hypothetical protein [Tenacibaculum finnmarkense genomovar ulcerans]MCD8447844.1 hypothetical protein [Tenacibaculum finnmarkense genomovar finnmarkense]
MINTKNISTKIFFEQAKKNITISPERKEVLTDIAHLITKEYQERERINLNFICTHNSRRSQFAQVWSFFAIEYFNLKNIFAYSGGTETTAFHRNTVKSLQKTGFEFNIQDFSHQNPRYLISFKGCKNNILGFSKTYDDPNNSYPYIAITTCDNADENCPFIADAIDRFHLAYTDPKSSDNTDTTIESYLNTSKQIAGELFYIFEMIKKEQ